MEIKYYQLQRVSKGVGMYDIRVRMIVYAKKHGNKPAARKFSVSVKTVRKWIRRHAELGKPGLYECSRKPKRSPNEMKPFWKFKIHDICNEAKTNNKRISGAMIKRKHGIPYSLSTVLKEMRACGYMQNKRKKHQRKRDLREIKQKYKAFQKIQIDVKYLDDIPEMYAEYKYHKLPKYQFTARCVTTGALFFAYAWEKTVTNAAIFLLLLTKHLERFAITLEGRHIQTDNGSEFTAPWNSLKVTIFTLVAEVLNKSEHRLIPPGAKTWQSDVETSHRLIEDELYACETFVSRNDFYRKAARYQQSFNTQRYNSYKGGTPAQLLRKKEPTINLKVLKYKPYLIDAQLRLVKDDLARIGYVERMAS